jgi:hypothetical protein
VIRIVHTRASGTLVFGTTRHDGADAVIGSASGGWRYSRLIGDEGAWYLPHSRYGRPRRPDIERLAAALRAAGHPVEVTITSSSNATAAIEADRAVRAAGRAARYTELADARISSATVRLAAVDARREAVPPGQPVINDRYAGFLNRLNRAEDAARAQLATGHYWQHRAEATASTQRYRHHPRVTVGRVERLEAEQRRLQRRRDGLDPTGERSGAYFADLAEADVALADLTDEIGYWRGELAAVETAGVFRSWTRDDFRPGDEARVLNVWYPVVRVNAKTLTVELPNRDSAHEPNTDVTRRRTDTSPYVNVYGRRRDGSVLHSPPPAEGATCTCRITIPTFNAEFIPERDGGPCLKPPVARLTIRHDGASCGCDGTCMLPDPDEPDASPPQEWTEVVLFCTDHAFEFQADIAAAVASEAATVEDLS